MYKLLFTAAFALMYFKGLLEELGVPTLMTRLAAEGILMGLFALSLIVTVMCRRAYRAPLWPLALLIFGSSVASYMVGEEGLFGLILFFRFVLIAPLAFYAFYNLELRESTHRWMLRTFEILFIVQIVVSIFKASTIGIGEQIVGTMDLSGGTLSATYSLMIIAIVLPMTVLSYRSAWVWVVILSAALMSIVGDKRATFFYAAILAAEGIVIARMFFRGAPFAGFFSIRRALVLTGTTFTLLVFSIIIFKSLNPDHKIGGTVDIGFVAEYIWQYSWSDWNDSEVQQGYTLGRMATMKAHFETMRGQGTQRLLMGYGPGAAVQSSLNYTRQQVNERFRFAGAQTGFDWVMLQSGLVGAVAFLAFYGALMIMIFRRAIAGNPEHRAQSISHFLVLSLVMMDYLTYSSTTFHAGVILPLYMYYVAAFLRGREDSVPFARWIRKSRLQREQGVAAPTVQTV